jgi:hypothetical protein
MSMITQERLKEVLDYDQETGDWRWRTTLSNKRSFGEIAGCVTTKGYRQITVDRRCYRSNRLAVLWMKGMWPTGETDHKDNDKLNDKWNNLRDCSVERNKQNMGLRVTNTTGVKWISRDRKRLGWQWKVKSCGEAFRGRSSCPLAAYSKALLVAHKVHGEFIRER